MFSINWRSKFLRIVKMCWPPRLWGRVCDRGRTIWSSGDLTFLWCPWHVSPPLHALLTLRCYLMEFYWRPLTYRHYVPLSWAMQNMFTLRHSPLLTLLMFLSSLEFQPCNKTMELGRVWWSLHGFWKLKFPHNYILIAPFVAILNQEWLMGIVKFLLGIRCFEALIIRNTFE